MCVICNGDLFCPVCREAPRLEECLFCCGKGERYFDDNGEEMQEKTEGCIIEACEECNQLGQILI